MKKINFLILGSIPSVFIWNCFGRQVETVHQVTYRGIARHVKNLHTMRCKVWVSRCRAVLLSQLRNFTEMDFQIQGVCWDFYNKYRHTVTRCRIKTVLGFSFRLLTCALWVTVFMMHLCSLAPEIHFHLTLTLFFI